MKIGLVCEGAIDRVLVPPLITTIAKTNGIEWPIDFSRDISLYGGPGFGGVKNSVENLVRALGQDPAAFKKIFTFIVVLLDRRTRLAQQAIRELIQGHGEFIFAIAIEELEAWVLADRFHVIQWLNNVKVKQCSACRFWSANYSPEEDPDPKQTLSQLVNAAHGEFDTWGVAAAKDFVDFYWRNSFEADENIHMRDWVGKADIPLMEQLCPRGFRDFSQKILGLLSR